MQKLLLTFLLFSFLISAQSQTSYFPFQADMLLCVSDGDMSTKAFVDGDLSTYADEKDYISLLYLKGGMDSLAVAKLPVSNSAFGVKPIAISHDKKSAFVIETRGPLSSPEKVKNIEEAFPAGSKLTMISLEDVTSPSVKSEIEIGANPTSVSIHPTENLLLVGVEGGSQFRFVEFDKNTLLNQFEQNLGSMLDIEGITVRDVQWSPNGDLFGVVFSNPDYVAFYKYDMDSHIAELIGEPVHIGENPDKAYFAPEGRFFIVNVRGDLSSAGELVSILVEPQSGSHLITAKAPTGINSLGFGISEDGKFIVVTTMNGSDLRESDPMYKPNGELILYTFNEDNGEILQRFKTDSQGPMPGDVFFDRTGLTFGYTLYEKDYGTFMRGIMDFRMIDVGSFQLVPTNFSLTVAPGLYATKAVK